jgi:glycosyltransferase involved in cell wall biosynthesis
MKFTIGLPITKTRFLKESLDSINSQTFKDFEVIIRNNANTPELKSEIKECCKSWIGRPNVKYYESEEQLKISENFNKIVERANGEYFMILSDDDIIEPDFLEEFNKLTLTYLDVSIFHCRVKIIDENNNLVNFSENCPEYETRLNFIHNRITRKRTLILSNFIISTKTLKKSGGFVSGTSGWGLDEITWLKAASNGIAYTDKVLLRYRTFPGNLSFNPTNMKKRFSDIEYMEREMEKMILEDINISKLYPVEYLIQLNKKRTLLEKDDVFINFASTNNFIDFGLFYYKNKDHISRKGFIKALARVSEITKY